MILMLLLNILFIRNQFFSCNCHATRTIVSNRGGRMFGGFDEHEKNRQTETSELANLCWSIEMLNRINEQAMYLICVVNEPNMNTLSVHVMRFPC